MVGAISKRLSNEWDLDKLERADMQTARIKEPRQQPQITKHFTVS